MENTKYEYQYIIQEEFAKKQNRNTSYSLRSYAKYLDISPGALSQILAGKKFLTFELADKIINKIELTPQEIKAFWKSIQSSYSENGRQRKDPQIEKIAKSLTAQSLDLTPQIFSVIADWYHYAILQLIKVPGFNTYDPSKVASALDIGLIQAQNALDKLLRLELLEQRDQKLYRTKEQLTTGDLSLTTKAFRKRIRQITELSLKSLENDPIESRNHTTMTMSIDPDKLSIAKDMIQNFMDELSEVLMTENKQVYELQINLFPLQKKEL